MTFHLQEYRGKDSRHECPNCHKNHCFSLYVDDNGEVLDPVVGRCDHEDTCQYHYTPKQYFMDHPSDQRERVCSPQQFTPRRDPDYIPDSYLSRSESSQNTLMSFLTEIIDSETIKSVCQDYRIGSTKNGGVIWWQIDRDGKVRTGKIMYYSSDGHRLKGDSYRIDWVHSILKKRGVLTNDFNLRQCLFGEHLLSKHKDKCVAIVESEKTAFICACFYPQFLWLAVGGKSQKNIERLRALQYRDVILYPDTDPAGSCFREWTSMAKELRTICKKVLVTDYLEKHASKEQKEQGCDIADLIMESIKVNPSHGMPQITALEYMIRKNSDIANLIDDLELVQTKSYKS